MIGDTPEERLQRRAERLAKFARFPRLAGGLIVCREVFLIMRSLNELYGEETVKLAQFHIESGMDFNDVDVRGVG